MNNTRSISQIVYANIFNMGDIKVRQPLPSEHIPYLDPFVLLHHGHVLFDKDQDLSHAGVGSHPHRGFSPVTFVFKGGAHHRDSRNNEQLVMAGGTQWMHAGMGIVHSERPVEHEMEIIQMWINSPAKHKMDVPSYHPLTHEQTPQYVSADGKLKMGIVTGELLGIKGPIPTLTPINAAMIHVEEGGRIAIPLPTTHHAFIYLLDGKANIGGKTVEGKNMAIFNLDGGSIALEALAPTRALLMSGEPIGETIVAQGPFVMNKDTEIMEAYRDFRMGKMGILVD